jgi:hypothetical protein
VCCKYRKKAKSRKIKTMKQVRMKYRVKEDAKNNLIGALRHKTVGPGFRSRWDPWKFASGLIFLYAFSGPRGLFRADSCVALVVSNIKARMESQHSILPLSLHDLWRESFTFTTFYYFKFKPSFRLMLQNLSRWKSVNK